MVENKGFSHIGIRAGVLAWALLLLSCTKTTPAPEEKAEPTPATSELKVEVSLTPGLRSVEKPIYTPSGTITVFSSDKTANYIIEFSVNGGETYTLKGIWDGRSRAIDAYLQGCEEYGEYTIAGRVYNVADDKDAVDFSEIVWMKYEPAEITEMRWATMSPVYSLEAGAFDEKKKFAPNEMGVLLIGVQPETSRLLFEISDEEGLFTFYEPIYNNGTCAIRYYTEKTGTTGIHLVAVNGDEREEFISAGVVVEEESSAVEE